MGVIALFHQRILDAFEYGAFRLVNGLCGGMWDDYGSYYYVDAADVAMKLVDNLCRLVQFQDMDCRHLIFIGINSNQGRQTVKKVGRLLVRK